MNSPAQLHYVKPHHSNTNGFQINIPPQPGRYFKKESPTILTDRVTSSNLNQSRKDSKPF